MEISKEKLEEINKDIRAVCEKHGVILTAQYQPAPVPAQVVVIPKPEKTEVEVPKDLPPKEDNGDSAGDN